MTCPSCKGELSKIWQPRGSSNSFQIPPVQWGCGVCGQKFSREQLQPQKQQVIAEPR